MNSFLYEKKEKKLCNFVTKILTKLIKSY
jgi:hypothetical protein